MEWFVYSPMHKLNVESNNDIFQIKHCNYINSNTDNNINKETDSSQRIELTQRLECAWVLDKL